MLPCSQVHWKILPAICRQLAISLEKEKISRKRIAALLGTTPAAISQYLSGKRGGSPLGKKARDRCAALAKKMAAGKAGQEAVNLEIARIIAIAKGGRAKKRNPCAVCASRSANESG
ncbi:MAG: hypothetical protein N3E51_00175 [Candidatus Micrarchaeota archaeon]|nr:hypothetical protein [Candidatus Micrarchaeota archaeon]